MNAKSVRSKSTSTFPLRSAAGDDRGQERADAGGL